MLRYSTLRILLRLEQRTTVLCVPGRKRNIGPAGETGEGKLLGTVNRMRRLASKNSS
jgi:hypothetical protein